MNTEQKTAIEMDALTTWREGGRPEQNPYAEGTAEAFIWLKEFADAQQDYMDLLVEAE